MAFKLFKKKETFMTDSRLDSVAIICDGNGRWARRRGLIRSAGHVAGAKRIQPTLEKFREIGVHHVTLYCFSTENWKRPQDEIDVIMKLIYKYLTEVVVEKIKTDKNFCVKFLGDLTPIPEPLRSKCIEVENMATDKEFVCNVALNYGGRDEIVRAARLAAEEGEITEESISRHMYTSASPDPDLIIRTGGDLRVSNFLLWQGAYSEFYVTDTLWPDFDEDEIIKAVKAFYKRKRRFGGLDKEDEVEE